MIVDKLQMKIEHIEENLKDVKEKVDSLPTRQEMQRDNLALIDSVIKECDKKYASKIIVDLMLKVTIPVMTAILVYLAMSSLK